METADSGEGSPQPRGEDPRCESQLDASPQRASDCTGGNRHERKRRRPTRSTATSQARRGSSAPPGGPPQCLGSAASLGGPTPGHTPARPRSSGVSGSGDAEDPYPSSECSSEELESDLEPNQKRQKSEKPGSSGLPCFDPADLVRSREGIFKAPKVIQQYVDKHFRCCLLKVERDALFKEHPRPDLDSCTVPKVDKFIMDFLAKRMPKEYDNELSKIQGSMGYSTPPALCRASWMRALRRTRQ